MVLDEYMEIIKEAENYFGKELQTGMHKYYYNAFKNLTPKQFNMLISIAIQECRYFPKIAELNQIKENVKMNKGDEPLEKVDCKICEGNGFIQYYKNDPETGYPYLYAARCTCSNGYNYSSYPLITEITDGRLVSLKPKEFEKIDREQVMSKINNLFNKV